MPGRPWTNRHRTFTVRSVRRVALLLGITALLCACGSTARTVAPAPSSVAELPRGAPPAIPYLRATKEPYDDNGILYVHGKPVARHVGGVMAAGSTVLAVHVVLKPVSKSHPLGLSAFHVSLVADGHETPLPALTTTGTVPEEHHSAISPVLSPRGRCAATEQRLGDSRTRVSLWSFGRRRLLGSIVVPKSDDEVTIDGVTDDGRVYVGVYAGRWTPKMWRPGREPQRLTGADARAERSGQVVVASNGPVRIPGDGDVDALTPDGTETAYADEDGTRAEVTHLATGDHVTLDAPGVVTRIVGFENDHSLLLVSGRPHSHDFWVLRCDTTTGACERAMTVPARGEFDFARLSWGC